jgi:hypothetical protein
MKHCERGLRKKQQQAMRSHQTGGDDAINYNANDPYHSYFEYGTHANDGDVLRGVTADIMSQAHSDERDLKNDDADVMIRSRSIRMHHSNQKMNEAMVPKMCLIWRNMTKLLTVVVFNKRMNMTNLHHVTKSRT